MNLIYGLFINAVANFVTFFIGFAVLIGLLIIPFLFKGGWLLAIPIYGFIGMYVYCIFKGVRDSIHAGDNEEE